MGTLPSARIPVPTVNFPLSPVRATIFTEPVLLTTNVPQPVPCGRAGSPGVVAAGESSKHCRCRYSPGRGAESRGLERAEFVFLSGGGGELAFEQVNSAGAQVEL